MNSRHVLAKSLLILAYSALFCSATLAQSFSWKDVNGNLVYGSRPPKNAKEVLKLKTRTLSRYSSDKVLSRLKSPESEIEAKSENDLKEKTSASTEESQQSFVAASLTTSSASVKFDAKNRLAGCKAQVKNESKKSAVNVSVAFEFKDGTLVPAVGPTEIASGDTVSYEVPADLLPLPLENSEAINEEVPEVIVHGLLSN